MNLRESADNQGLRLETAHRMARARADAGENASAA